MSPQDTLRRAIINDEFPDDPDMERLFTPAGEDLLKLNRNIALSAWMSQVSRSDINAGSATWQADKDALVQGYFKNPTATNVSDEQLHSLVKTHIQTAEEAADMAANMALQGKTSFEALKELNTKRGPSLVRPIWDRYSKDLIQRHSALSQKLAPYRGIVDAASSKLGKEMEWSVPTTQKFQEVATQLLQVPEEDRNLVISAIGATGGATAEERASYLSKLAGAMGRMTETMGSAIASDVESASLAETVVSLQEAGQMDFARKMEKNIQGRQEFNLLTQQIRQVADSEVSPIKGDNWWSQTGIDVARMAPQVAVTVANPIIGTAANLSYFRATVAAEAKQEDPSLTYQQADTIGALTSPFNTAIETVTALIPFGKVKLPFVQKWLSTATTSVMGTARKFVVRAGATVPIEIGEEMIQAIAPLWSQELLHALKTDMPDVDWEKRMPDFSQIAAQTWGPALVFGLVGGGAASINDIKQGRALASDRDTMVATGMAPAMADQIATAAESGDWSKADSLFRQEFVSTTKATDEEKTAAVARIIETQKAQEGFRSSSERGADALEQAQTIEKAMESLSRARVFRDAEGWAVEEMDTNDIVRVGSREEAVNLAYSRLDDNAREEAQSMAKVLEAYSSGGDVLELDLGRTMDLSETGDSEAAMKEAATTEAMLNGMSREQAEKITWMVLGSNRLETVEGVRRAVSRLFSGAGVMDAIEEPVEARFQAGLEQGVFTSDEAMSFVKIAAEVMRAPELVTTAESSARGLIEAVSDIVMADTFGQRKDGRKGVAGAVTAGLKARLRRQAELSGAESKFAAFLAAFRRFFKQVFQRSRALLKARKEGKLSNDFDEFLDTLMQVDPQRRHEAAAAKEAMEIAQEGNMPFSLGYLGNVQDSGNVQLKSVDLARGTHESEGLDQGSEGMGTFRYRKDNETVYWHLPPGELRKESAASALERKGFNVKRHIVMVYGSESALLAHGLDRDVARSAFSLAPRSLPEVGEVTESQEVPIRENLKFLDAVESDDTKEQNFIAARYFRNFLDRVKSRGWQRGDDYHSAFIRAKIIKTGSSRISNSTYFTVLAELKEQGTSAEIWADREGLSWDRDEDTGKLTVTFDVRVSDHEATDSAVTHADIEVDVEKVNASDTPWLDLSDIFFPELADIIESKYFGEPKPSFSLAPRSLPEVADTILAAKESLEIAQAGNMAFSLAPGLRKEFTVEAFHGTDSKRFDEFNISKLASGTGNEGLFSAGFYFSPNKEGASDYGKNLMSVKLRVKNPLTVPDSMPVMMRGDDSADYWTAFDAQMKGALKSVFSANDFNEVDRVDSIQMDETFVGSFSRAYKALSGVSLPPSKAAEVSAVLIQRAGFDAVYAVDDAGKTTEIVVYDPKNVLIEKFNGKPVSGASFSLTPQDTEYIAAVESGDMAKAQAMVDEAAKAAGYGSGILKHGSRQTEFSAFDPERNREQPFANGKKPWFFAKNEGTARTYGPNIADYLLKLDHPLEIHEIVGRDSDGEYQREAFMLEDAYQALPEDVRDLLEEAKDGEADTDSLVKEMISSGRAVGSYAKAFKKWGRSDSDGVIAYDTLDTMGPGDRDNIYIVFDPSQIKSADPVIYDESGQVIPLSQRFNDASPDISFSLAPRSLPEVADTILAAQMKKPAFFEAFVTLARRKMEKLWKDGDWRVDKRGIASKRVGFDSRMAGVRSTENIEAERKFRLRSRQRELIDAGMLALAPETLAAYDAGVASLEDVPMVKDMLGKVGKIMSKGAAQKSGKLKTDGVGSAGDYDGAPRLPPAWYAKSGGSMPYEIAQQLHDLGHLNDAYADTLWEALRSAIYSTRTANEAFKKAREAVRKVEADALAQAKKESDQWAKDETAKIPTEKERQMMALRTLDAILSAFPPEIRAKVGGFVKLAEHNSDAAREKEITRRLAKLEEVIEEEAKKHYTAKVEKLFKRFAPKKEAGKKATGQLDPDAQELVDAARAAMGYDDTRTRAELAAIDSMLAEDGLTTEREVQLERQRELVQLFGDFDNAESTRMESAADALEDTATEGWAKWKLKKIMERERRTEARQALIADTGKPSIGKERDKQNKWAKTKFGKAFSALLNVSSFAELLRFEFGEKSEMARSLEDQERKAAYAYEDAMQAFGDRVGDFFATLAGGRLAGEQLRFDLAQPTLTVGTGDNERSMSQLQGIQALLMWQQEDGRRHMEGSFDENGKPSGKWHYGEEWIADLESKLSPEAYQVKAFLEGLYGEEYQPLNAVYRQRHGVNLPKNERYSPITVQPMQAKAGEMVDPVSGFAVTGSILTPGGLRTRNKRAVAEPRFDDAVQIFLGHSRQMEHWKAYYDFATEAQAVLLNREVTNAVEAKGSTQAVTVLKKWVDQFAQGGSRDAQSGLEISSVYSRASGRAARVALLGRISTLLIQSGQLAAASVKMPLGAYLKRLGMLLSGNLDYTAAVNSPFIQRRYKTAPPIVQQALAGVGDIKRPNVLSSTTPRILGNALSGADALFTGGTYAIILDYHRSVTGPAMGLQGAELETFAQMEAERDTEAVAQPVRAGTRSIFENTLTSPLAKTGFAFASEARQKIALAAWAASRAKTDPAQAAKVAFLTFIVGGLVTQVLKNLWREAKDDDDEKMWSAERLVKATIAGPLHGVPGVSELMGDPGLFSGLAWSMGGVKKIATKAMEDDLDEVTMRDIENALSAAGYFNDTAAGVAGLSHLGFDFAKILQALAEED